ncbi:biotin-dependent carboxyltransferase family protein [Pedobacter aquatilis]|uniref:5-oxoprolinase subunit C family protein n=1 Tax=Pedobacter aquatilis TaxID=351343 RepID=UPI00292F1366|nr:biotin-dependent carboxyltransferase family protein [Pedobacter aquatilis]
MRISIIKPGIFSTIQDLGRNNFLDQAVPVSGAMDSLAHRIANRAIGNNDNAATIEFTYADASFKAETDILISYSGKGAYLNFNGQIVPDDRPLFFPEGSVIKLTPNINGVRTYLAISGGWDVPNLMGSKSTYVPAKLGGFNGRVLQKGDVLENKNEVNTVAETILKQLSGKGYSYTRWSIATTELISADLKTIRVVPANEFGWFDVDSILTFLSNPYTIGIKSNRMGYQLVGKSLKRKIKKELLSTAVSPGIIQVTGSGELIILMADCQTTGGYPRIARIADVDLSLCAQLKPGDVINFTEISADEAERLYFERESELSIITDSINFKYLI